MKGNSTRTVIFAALAAVLAIAVAALAGVSSASPGHGKGKPSASAAQYQYGTSGGKQYGLNRQAVCHKGHTIWIAQPAVKAHINHGDTLGTCPAASSTTNNHGNSGKNPAPTTPHGNSGSNGHGHSK